MNILTQVSDDLNRLTHQPIVLAGTHHQGVLISQQDWQAIQETLYLLSIPNMRESIKEGLPTPIEECEENLNW